MPITAIDWGLVEFLDMAENPTPFDPVSYKDRTDGWVNLPIALNKLRVTGIVNNGLTFGEGDSKHIRTERYANMTIDSENPLVKDKVWKVYNRLANENLSRSSPAFSQLCTRVKPTTHHTATMMKRLITPHPVGKDDKGHLIYDSDIPEAISLLNRGLTASKEDRVLRLNPDQSKIEAFVSDKYVPVKDKEILTFLQAEVGDFSIVREYHDDRRSLFQVLPDKFAGLSDSEEYGMFISNSNTGTNRIEMGLFVITGACSNGMMFTASKYGESEFLKRKHFGESEAIMDLIQIQCAKMGKRVEEAYARIELAKTIPLRGEEYSLQDLNDLLLKPLAESENFSKKTVKKVEELLKDKYNNDSMWDFIAALTEAAHEAPANSREHIEKAAGKVLELLVSSQ